jgi:hypothetical protein
MFRPYIDTNLFWVVALVHRRNSVGRAKHLSPSRLIPVPGLHAALNQGWPGGQALSDRESLPEATGQGAKDC